MYHLFFNFKKLQLGTCYLPTFVEVISGVWSMKLRSNGCDQTNPAHFFPNRILGVGLVWVYNLVRVFGPKESTF